jgi:hypothetical protein
VGWSWWSMLSFECEWDEAQLPMVLPERFRSGYGVSGAIGPPSNFR